VTVGYGKRLGRRSLSMPRPEGRPRRSR